MNPAQYHLFEEYSLGIKRAIEKNVMLESTREEDKVDVVYATPPVAFAKYLHAIKNGQQPGPNINFYLENITYGENENLLGFNTTILNGAYIRPPQIYKLSYKAFVFCNNESDGDILISQLLMAMPFNRPYTFIVNNQWATVYTSEPANETVVEAGEGKDKISRRSVVINIHRAYLNYPIREIRRFIKEFNVQYNIIEGDIVNV